MSLEYNAISRDALIEELKKVPADFMFTTLSTRLWRRELDISGIRAGGRHVYVCHKIKQENILRVKRDPEATWSKK